MRADSEKWQPGRPSTPRSTVSERVSRYDLLLWAIPLAFLLALVATAVFSMSRELSFVAASAVGALALLDGLFRNPPGTGTVC